MARTHVLDNRDELFRYIRGAMLAFSTAISEDIAKKLNLSQEQVEQVDKVIDEYMPTFMDNIKCFAGEYKALVDEGKIKEEDQYKPQGFKIGTEELTVDDLRARILAQLKDIETTFGLEEEDGNDND